MGSQNDARAIGGAWWPSKDVESCGRIGEKLALCSEALFREVVYEKIASLELLSGYGGNLDNGLMEREELIAVCRSFLSSHATKGEEKRRKKVCLPHDAGMGDRGDMAQ